MGGTATVGLAARRTRQGVNRVQLYRVDTSLKLEGSGCQAMVILLVLRTTATGGKDVTAPVYSSIV